jgi:hypothetical protein
VPLLLQIWAGYTLNDIAAALGCNITAIKTRVHRARVRFRQLYQAYPAHCPSHETITKQIICVQYQSILPEPLYQCES